MKRRVAIVILLIGPLSGCGAVSRSWNEFSGHPATTVVQQVAQASVNTLTKVSASSKASASSKPPASSKVSKPSASSGMPIATPPVVAARPPIATAPQAPPPTPTAPCISCQMTSRWSDKFPVLTSNGAPVYPIPNDSAVQSDGWVFTNVATPAQVADWYALSFGKGGYHLSRRAVSLDGSAYSFCISPQVMFQARPVFDEIYATPRTRFKVMAVVAPAVQSACA